MKVTLDLPEWAMEGDLRLISNHMELVAYKETGGDSPFMVKTVRCNNCGECCLDVGGSSLPHNDEGKCDHLVYENGKYFCNAGGERKVSCPSKIKEDYCVERFEKSR
jgi:hypothetical protein